MKKIVKNLNYLLGALLIMIGISLYAYPIVNENHMRYITSKYIRSYSDKLNHDRLQKEQDDRYLIVKKYNQSIFESHQEELKDVWSYEQVPTNLYCFEENMFGYVEIPAMDVKLALYIGADHNTLKKGAAILSQTSIPVGGNNVNCVIAGHRGYRGIPFFREIENLKIGDKIFITNPWEKLTYVVKKTEIIAPDDSEKVLIQPGKDMITLLTCHPYAAHGKQRYVVYCERKKTDDNTYFSKTEREELKRTEMFVSVNRKIEGEKVIRRIAGGILVSLFLVILYQKIVNGTKRIKT